LIEVTNDYLSEFAQQGLRTLLLAERTISRKEYDIWEVEYRVKVILILIGGFVDS
jgi:hypothetical protein